MRKRARVIRAPRSYERVTSSNPELLQSILEGMNYSLIKEFPYVLIPGCPNEWRADFAFPELGLFIEYEGLSGFGRKGGHTTDDGVKKDINKYNFAMLNGWKVLRVYYETVDKENLEATIKEIANDNIDNYGYGKSPIKCCYCRRTLTVPLKLWKPLSENPLNSDPLNYESRKLCYICVYNQFTAIKAREKFHGFLSNRSSNKLISWDKKQTKLRQEIEDWVFGFGGLAWEKRWKALFKIKAISELPIINDEQRFYETYENLQEAMEEDLCFEK